MKALNILVAAVVALGCAHGAMATIYTLTSGNSSALVNPDVGLATTSSQGGMYNWTVDNVNYLNQQWFFYRVGSSGPESGVNTLSHTVSQPTANALQMTFNGTGFNIVITYTLQGGQVGSMASDIGETIAINNTSGASKAISFFQYSDFNLSGSGVGNVDKAWMDSSYKVRQQGASGTTMTEANTTVNNNPNHYEISTTPTTLNKFNDGLTTTLSDTPAIGQANAVGPGDVTWAFEWDFNLASGGSAVFSKDKALSGSSVPDSGATVALLGAALTGLGLVGRRLRRR